MVEIDYQFPVKMKPIFTPSRYKSFRGGRGSAKSWSVARRLIMLAAEKRTLILCTRELQKSIKDSVHKLISNQIRDANLEGTVFVIQRDRIFCPGNGSEFLFYGLHHNIDEIKSLEGIDICWCEEAEKMSDDSWLTLIPTIRKPGSELWFSWNPKDECSPTYVELVTNPPKDLISITINYWDNPWFPDVLREHMEQLKKHNYILYLHVYEGQCLSDPEGAIIHPLWVMASINAHKILGFEPEGMKTTGLDVADGGKDPNAIVDRHGPVVTYLEEWEVEGGDTGKVAQKTFAHCLSRGISTRLVYDCIGIGAGVKSKTNELNENRPQKLPVQKFNAGSRKIYNGGQEWEPDILNKDFFANVKSQVWWMLARRFQNTYLAVTQGADFPPEELISLSTDHLSPTLLTKLKSELSKPKVEYDGNGKVLVESKKKLAKRGIASTNLADALICTEVPVEHENVAGVF